VTDSASPELTPFRRDVLDAIGADVAGVDSAAIARRLDTGIRSASIHANWLVDLGYAEAIPARVTYVLTDAGRRRLAEELGA
jgi:predicted transcriptional regulator